VGAAINCKILKELNIGVILIEEAGEILEPILLTSLYKSCEHLVLIGDHKQLRPKVNNYDLTQEAGYGYDFNISFFEKLMESHPHEILTLQHRMRPEISQFVRNLTYPHLVDSEKTIQYPSVKGIPKNVIFFDHQNEESNDCKYDNVVNHSRKNLFEAKMCIYLVSYFLLQGYEDKQIVILTPYSGQLRQIEIEMADKYNVILCKNDQKDDYADNSRINAQNSIRISTVDNFQGEEADIVIISLVRSNLEGSIGFVGRRERVNVMLSRAKQAMIILGNSRTLRNSPDENASELWRNILEVMEKQNFVFEGFPVQSLKRPDIFNSISTLDEFEEYFKELEKTQNLYKAVENLCLNKFMI
jgi:superfamily I DNA and/or RNA helicase